jgi:MerR family copper efflux transcriptional regulator
LWHDRKRPSRLVKSLAAAHIQALEQKVEELRAMKATLEHLVSCCHGDDRPECPILETLSQDRPAAAASGKSHAVEAVGRGSSFGATSRPGPRG